MNEILESLNGIIDSNYKTLDTLKRKSGVIEEKISDLGYAKYVVNIQDHNEKQQLLTLPNKSGERLDVGDRVLIYYWNTIADGYIALKAGASKTPGTLPNRSQSYSFCMTDDIETISDISTNIHYLEFNPEYRPAYLDEL